MELAKNKQGRYCGLTKQELAIGLSENLAGASGAAGLASYYGTAGANGGMNVPLWNALNGFENKYAEDAIELWKFEQKANQQAKQ